MDSGSDSISKTLLGSSSDVGTPNCSTTCIISCATISATNLHAWPPPVVLVLAAGVVSFEYLLGRTDAKQHEHAPFVDEMGLSEGAAAMLRAWKREGEQEKLDALSWIIEHEAVDTLLRFVKELNEKRATKSHRKPLSTCDMV